MLTERQRQAFDFIAARMEQDGIAPTYDEMAAHLDLRSKSGINRLIVALEERGFIRRIPCRRQAIEIIRKPNVLGAVNDDFQRGYDAGYSQCQKDMGWVK